MRRLPKAIVKRINYSYNYIIYQKIKSEVKRKFNNIILLKKSEKCLIVANGPSISVTDLSKYSDYDVITMNRSYCKWDELDLKPMIHVCINSYVLNYFKEDLMKLDIPVFTNYSITKNWNCENNIPLLLGFFIGDRVSSEIVYPFSSGGTVTFVSLNIAILLGYREIVVVGVDHSFSDKGNPNQTVVMQSDDRNHFFSDYFPSGMKWELPDLERSENSYKVIRRYALKQNIKIYDETVNGKLNVFSKR